MADLLEDQSLADTSGNEFGVCEKHNIAFSTEFCETCQIRLCSACTNSHVNHLISSIEKLAGGFKKKLHKMLNGHENDAKHLAKFADTAQQCFDEFNVPTKSELRQKVFSCMGKALENCDEKLDMKEEEVLDIKNGVQTITKNLKDELDDIKLKQNKIRLLLSETNETLFGQIYEVKSTTSVNRCKTNLFIPFDSKISSFDGKAFTSELEQLITKYVSKVSVEAWDVTLKRSSELSYALTCFRKRQPKKLKMASCDDFMCLGYVDYAAQKLNLEFIKTNSLETKTFQIDFDLEEEVSLTSGSAGVIVKVGEEKYLLYQKFDTKPIEVQSDKPILGFVKKGNSDALLQLNEVNSKTYLGWSNEAIYPAIIRQYNNSQIECAGSATYLVVENPNKGSQLMIAWLINCGIIGIVMLGNDGIYTYSFIPHSDSLISINVVCQSNETRLFAWKKISKKFPVTIYEQKDTKLQVDIYQLRVNESCKLKKIGSCEEFQTTTGCELLDVHYFGKSFFIKLKPGQILKLDGLVI